MLHAAPVFRTLTHFALSIFIASAAWPARDRTNERGILEIYLQAAGAEAAAAAYNAVPSTHALGC
jgi:hypothetical protein